MGDFNKGKTRGGFLSVFPLLSFLLFAFLVPVRAQTPPAGLELPSGPAIAGEVRFAAVGDTGTGGREQLELARRMELVRQRTGFTKLIFLGDNVYENGSPKDVEKKFLRPYAPLFLNGVELRGAIGNHDARSEYGTILQQMIFGMGGTTWYSFEAGAGLVEFYGLDTTLIAYGKEPEKAGRQLAWLAERLNASEARWKIAFMHHPLYSSAGKHGYRSSDADELERVRTALEPLFRKHGVRISLNGHDHVYERMRPQHGVHYFTSGAGGKLRPGDLDEKSPYYAYGNDRTRSFMLFSVTPERVSFWAIGTGGEVLDSGTIEHAAADGGTDRPAGAAAADPSETESAETVCVSFLCY